MGEEENTEAEAPTGDVSAEAQAAADPNPIGNEEEEENAEDAADESTEDE